MAEEVVYSEVLRAVLAGRSLTRRQTHAAFGQIMGGQWSEAQIAGLLVALAAKGETVEEIAGAAQAMRDCVVPIETGGADVIDTCGTGGTGLSTFNISTAAALVAAGAGAKVAKHGNVTHTRASGSANVLAALGVNLDAPPETLARCLAEAGVCFCYAIRHHPAMRHAGPVRKALGVRTIFNLLGPLTNPAAARRQLMGVFDAGLTETIARVLGLLGAERAMVVHADDGLDELSTTGPTKLSEWRDGQVTTRTVRPEDFGLPRATLDDLLADSPEASAAAVRKVLAGERGPARDIVVLNAAAALAVAGKAESIAEGIVLAEAAIDTGAAAGALAKLVRISNQP
ncbi:MAG TPA: anthranilate phosphoribosyltransferase [Phycisphaerae bacterium]|nr:anthranilate phosphoribosyltransferase [Phycisphaerae bacterium]